MFDRAIQLYTGKGWQIASQTTDGVQFKKPKRWNRALVITGLITAVFGFGLLILLLAVIDYAIKKEKSAYVSAAQIKDGKIPNPPSDWSRPVVIGLLIILVFSACMLLVILN